MRTGRSHAVADPAIAGSEHQGTRSRPRDRPQRQQARTLTAEAALVREELERATQIAALEGIELDTALVQERSCSSGDLECLGGNAPSRQLERARSVEIEPHLGRKRTS